MPLYKEPLFIFLFLLLFLIPAIFFLITQQNTLKAIQLQNRSMSPGEVWLQLIPVFMLVWQFVVVRRIADSIRKELNSNTTFSFEENQDHTMYEGGERPTYQIGIAYSILITLSVIPYPAIKGLLSLAGTICWIIYWVKLAQYKNKIQNKNYSFSPPAS